MSNLAKKKYACLFSGCNKSFGKNSRLTVHERIHTGERPFYCPQESCNKSYTRQFHLTRHIAVSHCDKPNTSKEIFMCSECGKNFNNIYSKQKHEQCHSEKKYSCIDCGQSFRKQQHLKTHSFEHTGIKPYLCDFSGCEKRYSIPSRLNRHSLSHIKGRYICSYETCPDTFDCYSDLRHHLTICHVKKCDICSQEFKLLSQLRSHLKVHDELREAYFCPYTPCESHYLEEKNLVTHIRSKHSKKRQKYECLICDKRLSTKQKLKHHINTHDIRCPKEIKPKCPRKPRKDKGIPKSDLARLLSGYETRFNSKCSSNSFTDVLVVGEEDMSCIEHTFSKKIEIDGAVNFETVGVK